MADELSDTPTPSVEQFVQLLTSEQMRLLHYIAKLLGDPYAANNVLQETNLVLWRKAHEFEIGSNFTAWARQIAFWQVRAYVRDRRRDRHVFSEELISQLANQLDAAAASEADESESLVALRHCMDELNKRHRDLLRRRYEDANSVAAIANQMNISLSAVKVRLLRVRRALLRCIEKQLAVNCHLDR